MLKTGLGLSARLGHSPLLCLVLAGTTLLAVACGADDASSKHRLRNGQGDGDGSGAGGNGGGANNGDSNNPETPTNQGPEHNAAGFTALAPLLRASCSECHHAGTWLDLTKGADAGTADKMIHSIEQGTMPPAPRTPARDHRPPINPPGQARAAPTTRRPRPTPTPPRFPVRR